MTETRRRMCGTLLFVGLCLGFLVPGVLPAQTLPAPRGQSDSQPASAASVPASRRSARPNIADLTAKASAGDAAAQLELGFMYDAGKGVAKDAKEAEKWYRKAAEQGDASTQAFLGTVYARSVAVFQFLRGLPFIAIRFTVNPPLSFDST
jgi:hypothetical protein